MVVVDLPTDVQVEPRIAQHLPALAARLGRAIHPGLHVVNQHRATMSDSSPKTIQLPTRQGYDHWSEFYDDEDNPLILLEHDQVVRLMDHVAGLQVLDAGCGTGRHALPLAAAGANVTAIDFSAGMLERARAKPGAERATFLQHDLETPLPFDANTFDRVISGLVVDHIKDLSGFFAELQRVCRPAGTALITVMHPALMLRGVQARFTNPETGILTLPASQQHQISDYLMAALQAGFSIQQVNEYTADDTLAARSPRAARYLGWPMLLLLELMA